jgi:hypothetical protein
VKPQRLGGRRVTQRKSKIIRVPSVCCGVIALALFTGGSFHVGTGKIRAKFGDNRCRKS